VIRQAQTYLAGAASSAALLAAAILGFIAVAWFSSQSVFPDPDIGAGEDLTAPFASSLEATVLSRASASAAPRPDGTRSGGAAADARGGAADQGGGGAPATDLGDTPGSPAGPGDTREPGAPSAPTRGGGTGGGASPAEGVGSTVNQTIDDVDEILGGTLTETGASGIVKGAVGSVTNPDAPQSSPVEAVGNAVNGVTSGLQPQR
jgi:hypothetical protein